MNYRERLELYKSGQLDEETRRCVEWEIQRQDAISDYLFEEQELPPWEGGGPQEEAQTQTLELIQASIRRAFVKMGILVAAAVLAVVALCAVVLPGLVSRFYYDPNEVVGRNPENEGLVTTRMDLDLSVYSELFLPGAARDRVIAQPEGWGSYRITIPQSSSFDGHFRTVEGDLSRGSLTLYNTDPLRPPMGNVFVLPEGISGGGIQMEDSSGEPIGPWGTADQAMAQLDQLSGEGWYTGYLSLSEVMDYDDFYQWYQRLEPKSGSTWCAVYTQQEDGGMLGGNVGFSIRRVNRSQYWDTQRYPYLCQMGPEQSFDPADPQQAKLHFVSMLRYLQDHPQIVDMMAGPSQGDSLWMERMVESVERDGLRIYGLVLQAQKETLRQLAQDPNVRYLYAEPMS